jgi:hypothetical protein
MKNNESEHDLNDPSNYFKLLETYWSDKDLNSVFGDLENNHDWR